MGAKSEHMQRQELLKLQDVAVDAIAVPTVHAIRDANGFDVPKFVSNVAGVGLPQVRTRLDAITGWRGDMPDWIGSTRLLWIKGGEPEYPQRYFVNETHKAAAALLAAETIVLGEAELPMAELQELITEQIIVDTLMRNAVAHQTNYARWPELPI